MVLAEGDLLNSHIFYPIGIRLQLIDVQHKNITLDLIWVSMHAILKVVRATHVHQAETGCRFLSIWPEARAHSTCCASRVNKESAFHLKCLKTMSTAPQQDINVHLPGRNKQCIGVSGWHDGVTVSEADS